MAGTHVITPELSQHLGFIPSQLRCDLRRLEASDQEAWSLIASGRLRTAVRVNRAFNGFNSEERTDYSRSGAAPVHHDHTHACGSYPAVVRLLMTNSIRYEKEWQYQGRLMMTSIVAPAQQITRVPNMAAIRPETDRLAGSFLNNGNLIALAEAVQRRMPMLAGNRSFPEAERIMREQVAAALAKLTAITPAALAAEDLGMRDFVSARIDVSASQCVVILAAMLLDARRQVDICLQRQSWPPHPQGISDLVL